MCEYRTPPRARSMFRGERFKNSKTRRFFFGGRGHLRGFFMFVCFLFFCLWVLEVSLSRRSTRHLYKTRRRQKLVSQLPVFVHYVCEGGGGGALLQQVVASDWCIGGWKQRTCSTVELSVSTAFMYLLRMAKISLLRIWYFLMRSAIFFSGCGNKEERTR